MDHNASDDERLIEALKPHPLIGYREPFYYRKEHPNIKNNNEAEILLHFIYSKDHPPK